MARLGQAPPPRPPAALRVEGQARARGRTSSGANQGSTGYQSTPAPPGGRTPNTSRPGTSDLSPCCSASPATSTTRPRGTLSHPQPQEQGADDHRRGDAVEDPEAHVVVAQRDARDHADQDAPRRPPGRRGAGGAGRAASPRARGRAPRPLEIARLTPTTPRNVDPQATWSARQPPLKGSMSHRGRELEDVVARVVDDHHHDRGGADDVDLPESRGRRPRSPSPVLDQRAQRTDQVRRGRPPRRRGRCPRPRRRPRGRSSRRPRGPRASARSRSSRRGARPRPSTGRARPRRSAGCRARRAARA